MLKTTTYCPQIQIKKTQLQMKRDQLQIKTQIQIEKISIKLLDWNFKLKNIVAFHIKTTSTSKRSNEKRSTSNQCSD